MYRLRLLLMIVLSLGLVGGAAALALRGSKPAGDEEKSRLLARRLADNDPDVRREAEDELRKLNKNAIPALREASCASDTDLAKRASRLLEEMEGRVASGPAAPSPAPEPAPAPVAPPNAPSAPIEIVLIMPKTEIGIGESLRFYVRLSNNSGRPVLVARQKARFVPVYRAFAEFEVTGAGKGMFSVAPELWPEPEPEASAKIEVVAVAPGTAVNLYPGGGEINPALHSWMRRKGEYRIRFVYDATRAYPEAVAKSTVPGEPLPEERIASDWITVAVR